MLRKNNENKEIFTVVLSVSVFDIDIKEREIISKNLNIDKVKLSGENMITT